MRSTLFIRIGLRSKPINFSTAFCASIYYGRLLIYSSYYRKKLTCKSSRTWANTLFITKGLNWDFLPSTLTGSDIAYAGGWSQWRSLVLIYNIRTFFLTLRPELDDLEWPCLCLIVTFFIRLRSKKQSDLRNFLVLLGVTSLSRGSVSLSCATTPHPSCFSKS